jgi:hypothetical protein
VTPRMDYSHEYYWPMQTHKRWRLIIADWKIEHSVFSQENKVTSEEQEDILALCRRKYNPPLWLIKSEEWEALGRPRAGKAYEAHCKKWDEIMRSDIDASTVRAHLRSLRQAEKKKKKD